MNIIMDIDAPHSLGEASADGKENNKWLQTNDVFSSCRDSKIIKKLPAGTYSIFQDGRGALHAAKFDIETDELYVLPNNNITTVIDEIGDFWKKHERFKQYKFKHKRGILFMGPPGTGKTSLINLLTIELIKNDGLVFYIDSALELSWYIEFIHSHLREIQPSTPVITVLEDIDKYMDGGNTESTLLNFMDGVDSFDHHVVVATTNRIDQLNDLILRPSRLDWQIEVDKPDAEVRAAYLVHKGLDEETAKAWAGKDTDDYSLAELKELFVSVKLLDIDYDVAREKLKSQAKNVGSQTFKKKSKAIGF